jgi:NhaA family Na+:H+ antiporter
MFPPMDVATTLQDILAPPLRPIDRVLSPMRGFLKHRLAGAALLMVATIAAILIANSPLSHAYHHFLHQRIEVDAGLLGLDYTIHHWINDGLMSVFFFLVGLEIKRELLVGELSSVRKATLPAIAAVGGMVVPAAFYALFNAGTPTEGGWGIPMATDIAFALGVLALLGDRVPIGAKVFLTALAIVDDIGAVLVIALFYTAEINMWALGTGFALLALAVLLNRLEVRSSFAYLLVGTFVWVAFLKSGIHATIAAILMAFVIPATTRINGRDLVDRIELITAKLKAIGLPEDTRMNSPEQEHALVSMGEVVDHAQAPLQRIEHDLHGPVTFFVLPVFALANAGVTLGGNLGDDLMSPVAIGIVVGLFFGKQLGITLATWLAVKLKVADLPRGVSWKQIHGANILAGVGFTMSLFVSSLAFTDPHHVEQAKIGILTGSILSGIIGYYFLSTIEVIRRSRLPQAQGGLAAATPAEAGEAPPPPGAA